ncbi:MAG: AraC family transcriptional regulator [Cyanosarcina radialis HA8281-LM2]|jgi:AraC-like DNA-binding protein|nr:AraC family transcriptional regulator [Cyanosarcina radialis HA8281-LM2]
MTLILNETAWEELYQQAPKPQLHNLVLDDFEELSGVPEHLGQGYCRLMELLPGVWLNFWACEFNQDSIVKVPVHDHLVQISVFLSGSICCDGVHPNLSETRSYLSGSGVSPAYVEQQLAGQRLMAVNVEIEPALLDSLVADEQRSHILKLLFKGDDWKASFYPTVTPKLRSLAQQLWNAPYRGAAKRLYLQAKVFELLAMQLDWLEGEQSQPSDGQLKPSTIDRIYQARDIVLANLEHPPSVLELAQQVGVSASTLQRKFRELFGKTVFDYLTERRMDLAKQLLRQGNCTVVETATMVGYSNPAHFAAAFKRKFGITPSECILGKLIVSR